MPFFETKKDDRSRHLTCADCGLFQRCKSPKMKVSGEGRLGVLIIAEAPGKEEDEQGVQLIGKGGQYLKGELESIGVDLHKDCYKINAVNCRPPKNRDPTQIEINACRRFWIKAIEELKPTKVILLGKFAIESFLGHRMTEIGPVSKWIGWEIPDQDYKVWVFPNYHPSYVMRQKRNFVLQDRFCEVLETAFDHNEPFYHDKTDVEIITNLNEAIEALEFIKEKSLKTLLSFDYEGTGLKPHRKEQKIISESFCFEGYKAYSIKHFVEDWRCVDLLREILHNKSIPKTAHNLKFEETWTRVKLGVGVLGWKWDTMLASHCLDNRGGISGLKRQTYLNFGVIGYDDFMKPYLEGTKQGEDPESDNRINRIEEAPINKVLNYGGLDSIYGRKLALVQMEKMPKRMLKKGNGYRLFMDGILAFADTEEKGWEVDINYYDKVLKHIQRTEKKYKIDIKESDENKLWLKKEGSNINLSSMPQLRKLFFDYMNLEPTKFTKATKDNNEGEKTESVDAEALEDLSKYSLIASKLSIIRKNKTIKDKVNAFKRESIDNIIHPVYNLHIPRSYRSSCNSPNMQNNFKRDPFAKMLIRTGILAGKGNFLVDKDYSGVEVSTGCFYHKDPVMMKYVETGAGKMHTDQAVELFFLDRNTFPKSVKNGEKWAKAIRHISKNMFVFPQFYGANHTRCSNDIWKAIQNMHLDDNQNLKVIDHLYENGIKNYEDFEQHIKEIADHFWNKKFVVYNEWKEQCWEDYQVNGYINILTGFRCTDILNKNEAINRSIQGTAFHLLLWAYIETNKELKERQMDSYLIGQIHDDMLAKVPKYELEEYHQITEEIEMIKIRKHWDWINVPLIVETEISELNGNWHKMDEIRNIENGIITFSDPKKQTINLGD